MARSSAAYLLFHRGISHSLLGVAVLPPLLAVALWWGLGRRTRLAWLLALCWLGVTLHVLYDLLTSWGTMLLYPFSLERHAFDWIFIVDPVTWLAPAAAILVAWRRPAWSRPAGILFLAAVALWAALSGAVHGAAVREVDREERASGRAVAEAFAFPLPGAPWRWRGLAVAPSESPEIARYTVRGIPPSTGPPTYVARGFDDPWVARALETPDGQAYLWWAAVPLAVVDTTRATGRNTADATSDEVVVRLMDLRYSRTIAPAAEAWAPFSLRFTFDARTGDVREVAW